MGDLQYQAGYAKSGRAECKHCGNKIDQGTLRFAVTVQSKYYDGNEDKWHHEECFFEQNKKPTTVSDISNLNKLKHEDQVRIKNKIASTSTVMPEERKETAKKRASENESASSNLALKDFRVEYSKSSRASCTGCGIKICKDEVRICKVVFDTEVGSKFGGQPLWHHVSCFNKKRSTLLFFAGGESLPGFDILSKEDQDMVKKEIKPFETDEVPVKKFKVEPKDEAELKEEYKEQAIEKQNKLFHKNRNALSELNNQDVQAILKENSQYIPVGRDECLDHLADMMAFGALLPCTECKEGQLVLDTFGYKCTGNISEWAKCSYVTQEPKREPMIIPSVYKNKDAFKWFKQNTDVRLFTAAPRSMVIVKEEVETEDKILPVLPLKNLQFLLYGKLKDKEDTKKRILKLGGLVASKLKDTTVAVVATKQDVERMSKKMRRIQAMGIEVVEASFLDKIEFETDSIANSLQLIKEHNIAEWGSDPATRVPQDVIDGKSIPKSKPSQPSVKLVIKDGTTVDPDSGLQDVAHVYKDYYGNKYTVTGHQTDVVTKKNSFYKLQVLEENDKSKYYLFRSWGRTGTNIGSNKLEVCKSAEDAVNKFEDIYTEKTGNRFDWKEMTEKAPGRYFPLDVDYGADVDKLEVDKSCKLAMPVQKLITTIFDVNTMKKTLLEFELDTEKMPLGNLSKKQINEGYQVLTELLTYIESGSVSQSKIIEATNRFFTLVPHGFGTKNAPLLDNVELVKKKAEMLDNLLEIEIAFTLLKTDSDDTTSPIESHYLKLKSEIVPLARDSDEFKLIEEYTRNTHAATHSSYTLEIAEVFKVVRDGEDKRYKPFRKLHNRKLLWHGSRVTNFAGILSQGLRIAPPEAPVTGYMFGKGLYFADMVSKSAQYCCTNESKPVGLMLLCEVALGDMKECYRTEDVKLPADKHSVWGVGRTEPDPAGNRTLDCGTIVPMGKPYNKQVKTSLFYNEFIVYDESQVNVKYLLQMKFNPKY